MKRSGSFHKAPFLQPWVNESGPTTGPGGAIQQLQPPLRGFHLLGTPKSAASLGSLCEEYHSGCPYHGDYILLCLEYLEHGVHIVLSHLNPSSEQ